MPGVEGRVTMVTGAGRGIGRVAAGLLASRGARVMAVDRLPGIRRIQWRQRGGHNRSPWRHLVKMKSVEPARTRSRWWI